MVITTLLLFYRELNMNEKSFSRFLATVFEITYYSAGGYKEQLSWQSAWQVSKYIEGETNLHLTTFLLAKNRCSLAWPLLCLLPILNHNLLLSMEFCTYSVLQFNHQELETKEVISRCAKRNLAVLGPKVLSISLTTIKPDNNPDLLMVVSPE